MTTARSAMLAGVRDVAPALLGSVPFGLAFGAAAIEFGFSPVQTIAMSALIFGGASQFAALELLGRGASPLVVIIAIAVVNTRFLMYSASIASFVRTFSTAWKWFTAFLLTDMSYAFAIAEFPERDGTKKWYYLGMGTPVWFAFVGTTVAGVLIGAQIPEGAGIGFVIPLVFIGLLAPTVEDRATLIAAITGGTVAVVGGGIPFNAGLLVATLIGIGAGFLTDWRWSE